MANDLTWAQLQQDIGTSGAITCVGNNIHINVNLITGDNYADINAKGVTEFVQKLINFCNKTQNRINQGVEVGQRLAAFPNQTLGAPTKDTEGVLRVTCTQQIISRLTVSNDEIVGNQN